MNDLMKLMNQLVDTSGKILVPGLQDLVAPVTDEEAKLYDDIDFDPVSKTIFSLHIIILTLSVI